MTLLSRTPNAVSNFFFQSGCLLTIAVAMSFSLEALAKTKSDTAPPPESSSMMPERPQESVLQIDTRDWMLKGGSQSTLLQGGSQSTMLQGNSQSTLLQGGSQSTLLQGGSQSTLLQGGSKSTLLEGGTKGAIIQGGVEHIREKLNILFLLDCSRSMREKFSSADPTSEEKMVAAKKVLDQSLEKIPADINVGLRTFGQGFSASHESDCMQTALLVPLGIGNREAIKERVKAIKAFGLTPLEYALKQAVEDDFRGAVGTKVIILISDGADTCDGHPCKFIEQLPKYGIKLKIDVVGLDLKEQNAKEQLNCIAESSGGKFYDANTAGDLIKSVSTSVDRAISGRVIMHPKMRAVNTEVLPDNSPSSTPITPNAVP
jgi:Ca-activated chloride channel family protein